MVVVRWPEIRDEDLLQSNKTTAQLLVKHFESVFCQSKVSAFLLEDRVSWSIAKNLDQRDDGVEEDRIDVEIDVAVGRLVVKNKLMID